MTKEERAKDYAEHNIGKYTNDYANIYNAYLKGAEAAKFEAFSVMCEKVEELEKENAKLKNQCDTLDKSLVVSTKNNIERQKIIDECKERIAELEAENEANKNGAKNYADFYFETNNQLIKAKEIIKDLLSLKASVSSVEDVEKRFSVRERAEAFLKESEKMIDMELAEDYYYKTFPVTLNIGEEERKKKVTDIFLEGLKAGRPQWHDLRKDPNDLPKEVGNYIVCYLDTACERHTFELSFVDYFEDKHWINEDNHNIEGYDEGVIAWCEIPKYTEE